MKRLMVNILGVLFFRWAYPGFDYKSFPTRMLLKCFIAQKIFCINSNVPWPVHWTSVIKASEKIIRGTETPGSGMGCYFDARNGIILEDNVWIGPKVTFISMDHSLSNYNDYKVEPPIKIGRDSLITSNSIILPGVELGPHTVVAAGAVVTKSFPEGNQILAGNPARKIKALDDYKG